MPLGRVPKRTSGSAGRSLVACGQGWRPGGAGALRRWSGSGEASQRARAEAQCLRKPGADHAPWQGVIVKTEAGQAFRATWKPAKLWLTGISSIVLMLRCGGRVATQWIVSAMSSAVIGSMSA